MKLTVETLQNLSFNHRKTFNNLTKHVENLTKAKKDRQKTGKKGNTNQLVGPANHPPPQGDLDQIKLHKYVNKDW